MDRTAAHLQRFLRHPRNSHFRLLQHPHNLLHRKSLPLHGKTPSSIRRFCRKLTL